MCKFTGVAINMTGLKLSFFSDRNHLPQRRKSFLDLVKPNQIRVAISIFWFIWNKTKFCLGPNQSENCKYNPSLVWFKQIQKRCFRAQCKHSYGSVGSRGAAIAWEGKANTESGKRREQEEEKERRGDEEEDEEKREGQEEKKKEEEDTKEEETKKRMRRRGRGRKIKRRSKEDWLLHWRKTREMKINQPWDRSINSYNRQHGI